MTLRELRLWHWRKVLAYRAAALTEEAAAATWEAEHVGYACRYRRNRARNAHKRANWHLGAVQVLNDHFPLGDTAEQDAAK